MGAKLKLMGREDIFVISIEGTAPPRRTYIIMARRNVRPTMAHGIWFSGIGLK